MSLFRLRVETGSLTDTSSMTDSDLTVAIRGLACEWPLRRIPDIATNFLELN